MMSFKTFLETQVYKDVYQSVRMSFKAFLETKVYTDGYQPAMMTFKAFPETRYARTVRVMFSII